MLRKLSSGEFCSDEHRLRFMGEQEKLALARLVDAQQRFTNESKNPAFSRVAAEEGFVPLAGFATLAGTPATSGKSFFYNRINATPWDCRPHLPRLGPVSGTPSWAMWRPSQPAAVSAIGTIDLPASGICPFAIDLSPKLLSAPSRRRTAVLQPCNTGKRLSAPAPIRAGRHIPKAQAPLRFEPKTAMPRRRAARVLDGGLVFDTAQALARIEALGTASALSKLAVGAADMAIPGLARMSMGIQTLAPASPRLRPRSRQPLEPSAAAVLSWDGPRPAAGHFAPPRGTASPAHVHLRAKAPLHASPTLGARMHALSGLTELPAGAVDSPSRRMVSGPGKPIRRLPLTVLAAFSPDTGEPALSAAGLRAVAIPPAFGGRRRTESNFEPYEPAVTVSRPVSGPLAIAASLSDVADSQPLGLVPADTGAASGRIRAITLLPQPDPAMAVPGGPALVAGSPASCTRLQNLFIAFSARDLSAAPKGVNGHKWIAGGILTPRFRRGPAMPEQLRGIGLRGASEGLGFWRRIPAKAAWAVMAIPLAIGLLQLAPGTSAGDSSSRPSFIKTVKRTISERAGLEVFEDFRSGLSQWQGGEGWAKSWAYDQTGFIRTGRLALFYPSARLTDYRFDFLGRIEKKSLSWVFRAKDLDNYYAARIVITHTGRTPSASLSHYAVINGKESARKETPLPFPVQADTLYQVRMDLKGSDFTVTVQDKVVDTWSDDRLTWGGFGFFSSKGEQSLLRWVSVSHQYDALGRLCALIAPYSLQPTKGE